MENPFDEQQRPIQRPTFLMVLCILTFIGSGWGVLSNLYSVFTSGLMDNATLHMEQYSNMVNELEDQSSASFMSGFFNSSMGVLRATAEHAREIAILSLVLNLVSLLGGFDVSASSFRFLYLYGSSGADVIYITLFCWFFNFGYYGDALVCFYSCYFCCHVCFEFEIYALRFTGINNRQDFKGPAFLFGG